MKSALARLQSSLEQINDVANDMDSRILSSSSGTRSRDETLRCSCTVILSGFLETFLKEIAEKYVHTICDRKVSFHLLPKKTQQRHFIEGGKLLGLKFQNHGRVSWINANYEDMVQRLSSPTISTKYVLLWEAYATTQGNPGPSVIEEILRNLGVDKCPSKLDTALGGNYPTDKLALQSFIEVRNECAHTGSALTVPSTNEIRGFSSLIFRIAEAVVKILEERLGQAPFGININSASRNDLEKIPGLGPTKINALISYRNTNGLFSQLDELNNIPGFGSKVLQKLKLHLHI